MARFTISVLALISSVSAAGVCSQPPYALFSGLAKVPAALSFCSSKFPVKACTSSAVSTSTLILPSTVATVTTTIGTVTSATTVATATVTNYDSTSTATDFTGTTTITSYTGTITDTAHTTATVTQTTTVANPAKRALKQVDDRGSKSSASSTKVATTLKTTTKAATSLAQAATPLPALLSALTAEAESFISTVCSCIVPPAPCNTITSQVVVTSIVPTTATSSVTGTVTDSVTVTTTIATNSITRVNAEKTDTVLAATTTTVTDTSTSTVWVTATPTPPPINDCTGANYRTDTYGLLYQQECGQLCVPAGRTIYDLGTNQPSFTQCMKQCGMMNSLPNVVQYNLNNGDCICWTSYDKAVCSPNAGYDSAWFLY